MDPRPWLHRWDPDARRRLICFGPAGRGTSDFQAWRERLPGGVELLAVVLPGRERRLGEPLPKTWSGLVDPLADRLAELVDACDTVLYGHSMGSWIAFDLVRRFQTMGIAMPLHLVVAARRGPQVASDLPAIAGLDDEAFVAAVQERYGAIPEAILGDPELMSLFLPSIRGDFGLLEGYRFEPGPPIEVPITALHGSRDPVVELAGVERWGELTSRTFRIHTVRGGHFFVKESAEEVVDVLAPLFRRDV
ncbi:MAG: alpha/beta fold hydrolase [Myxococcota bacterium]